MRNRDPYSDCAESVSRWLCTVNLSPRCRVVTDDADE